jgi:hypothetical protein
MELLVQYTNINFKLNPDTKTQPESRRNSWENTTVEELYTYFGITIYMAVYKENRLEDY